MLEDNKLLLRAKYDEAKALGEAVNAAKGRINDLKGHIELWRAQRAAACELPLVWSVGDEGGCQADGVVVEATSC